jgi:two-component system, NarL family, sensor kinase
MSDKQVFALIIAAGTLLLLFAFFTVYILIHQRNRQNMFFMEKQKMLFEMQKLRIEEGERMMNEISREIHDNIGQMASLVRMKLHLIETMATDEKQIRQISETGKLVDQVVKDAQNISHSLNSDFIQTRGLYNTLDSELKHVSSSMNISYNIEVEGDLNVIDEEHKLFIYRIAQEAIHNIVKHAAATNIDVSIYCMQNVFRMVIADNGQGFSSDKLFARNGIGLNNMRQRAKFLHGRLQIASEPGAGCKVTLIVDNINYGKL